MKVCPIVTVGCAGLRECAGKLTRRRLAAAEHYLVQCFEDVQLLAIHGNRVTIMPKDFRLLMRLRR